MAKHILMTYATRHPHHVAPAMPEGAQYDPVKGYWCENGKPLIASGEFLENGAPTKKADQETGEDQKGE